MELIPVTKPALTRAQFERLAEVSPEEEWLDNLPMRKHTKLTRSMCGNSSRVPGYATTWHCDPLSAFISSTGARNGTMRAVTGHHSAQAVRAVRFSMITVLAKLTQH
jgi:hypothetical protein